MVNDFLEQIKEDISEYQEYYSHIDHIEDDDWAFNFWILDKLYHLDEQVISENIIDFHDKGVDCYVWYENSKDLFLIQNKYYKTNKSKVSNDYIQYAFLERVKDTLEKGEYTHCKKLQDIFTNNRTNDEFAVHFCFYIANNSLTDKNRKDVELFNEKYAKSGYDCKLYDLHAIEELYYGKSFNEKQTLIFKVTELNSKSILSTNFKNKDTQVNAKYIITPISLLNKLFIEADSKHYPLFESNVRKYLGESTVNKKIRETLTKEDDRDNFIFYNNGITMIVDQISNEENSNELTSFDIVNPRIVNGCQTVSTIHETLLDLKLQVDGGKFNNTFVMVKLLEIPPETSLDTQNSSIFEILRRNIVQYNNNQNAIASKDFVANEEHFHALQDRFEEKGVIIYSRNDKYEYFSKYNKPEKLLKKSKPLFEKFSLPVKKTQDISIALEKLLQVFLAFKKSAYEAVQNKADVLKGNNNEGAPYRIVSDFIKSTEYSINDKVNLMLLYKRAEREQQKNKNDKKALNPFYLIYTFNLFECADGNKISDILRDKESVNAIIKKHKKIYKNYYRKWVDEHNGKEYGDMIKSQIDEKLLFKVKEDYDNYMNDDD